MSTALRLTAPATDAIPSAPPGLERVAAPLPLDRRNELRIVSGVLYLAQHSPLHARYPIRILNRRIRRPLRLAQFHYYTDTLGVPVAFCNWAWLTASVLDDVLATGRDLRADEFDCGDLPFFYEFLAPFGHCRAVVRGLRELPGFKGRRIPAIRGQVCGEGPRAPQVRYFQF